MNNEPTHQQYDFSTMPLSLEQRTLNTLERIEVLLQTLVTLSATTEVKGPSREDMIAAMAADVKPAPAPTKKFGRR